MTSLDPAAMRGGLPDAGRARERRRTSDRPQPIEYRFTRDPADPAFRPGPERLRGTAWLDRLVDEGDDA